ncbi:unnamed protein product [Rotaria sordida]|uniref:Nucleolar 27S pre-rRNA processing Urb2/Npa2 C-terminal domain-containing protein n=1 Tax=Rotaria sordida TaxID=392033 RepID=A0A819KVK6_9BILA|nr:unnamed protein product [Rotaria sordida]
MEVTNISGLDSIELVHRVWRQLIFCLKNLSNEQVTIKPSFIKALIETLGNENGESNNSAIECCLLIGNHGKELDYKYEQLVDLLRIVLIKHKENEQLLTMVLNKYWTTVRVQGNINKVFLDLSKQLFSPLLDIRSIYSSLSSLIDDILKHIIFHRTWITAYRDYIQSLSSKKTIPCPVSPLFTTLETHITAGNSNVISFLPLIFRHCINLIDSEKVSDIFELLVQMNTWLEQIQNDDLYLNGICQLLQILDEKHLIDQLLNNSLEERITNWMKDILFKRTYEYKTENYANLCVICLYLHPTLIETNLFQLFQLFIDSEKCLSIFLIGYIGLYSRMRSLAKLTKRLTIAFEKSIILPENVLKHYRKCISECTHTLIDEIWLSLLDQLENSTIHLIIIQLISALLDGYRLFDLNISRAILIEQNQLKYNRTLEKLRQQVNETMLTSSNSSHRICILQCYLSLGWFSLCLLSFSSSIPPVDDIYNHNGPLLSHAQWMSLQSDIDIQSILFSLACQRLYRALATNENDIDRKLIENLLELSSFSSTTVFDQLEPFFDFLSKTKQYKLIKLFIKQIIEHPNIDRTWFISNEDRLQLVVQASVEYAIETNSHDDFQPKKRRKIDFEENTDSFYDYLQTKSCTIDGKIMPLFSSINFDSIQTSGILISIGWLALNISPISLESMQILLDIIYSSKTLPLLFISHLLDFTLNTNNEKMIDQVLTIISNNSNYQSILKIKANKILDEMKTNEDYQNICLLEKYLLLFNHSRSLISSNDLCLIIDRLINSSSHSSISYSLLDTRYILAMIILNSLTSFDKYLKFLQQTWKSLVRDINETNHLKQVVIAYAKQWEYILKLNSTIDDIDALVKCLNDQYELISKVIQSIEQNQFQQWIENIIQNIKIPLEDQEEDINNCRQAFQLLQTLSHCSLNKENNLYFLTIINSVITQCGSLLIHLPIEFSRYIEVVSFVLSFANDVLLTKKSQLRSQVALSLLQCCLHLPMNVLFSQHANICKLVSLLIKHHTITLCKHVSTVETIIKLLLQSIVIQVKENQQKQEDLIEAARDITKLSAHLIEQCKDDFRSTIVYVLIDYVHLLSKGVFISPALKKTLNGVAFELFRISGERVEQYSGQMSIAERELLKQLHQQFKQYHMFKGII